MAIPAINPIIMSGGTMVRITCCPKRNGIRFSTKKTSIAYVRRVYPHFGSAYNNGRRNTMMESADPSPCPSALVIPRGLIRYSNVDALLGNIA